MGLFNKEIVYTDVLQDWRVNKVGDFNFLDKVIIEGVLYNSLYGKYIGKIGLVASASDKDYYRVILPDLQIIECTFIKPYYGEFQEEMEALVASKKAMEEVEELSKKLVEKQKQAEELYNKGKKAVEKASLNQFGIGKLPDSTPTSG